MNVLITNDDGYDAEGIQNLIKKLSEKHNVYVVAPDGNRSAVSSHLSMFKSLSLEKRKENHYTCSGYPADCAFVGIESNLFNVSFDCVVSGINLGGNLGTDIIYSGTCAAARQAALLGVPAIAVSVDLFDYKDFRKGDFKTDAMAEFILKNLESLVEKCKAAGKDYFLNVNALSQDSYKGVKTTSELCRKIYGDKIKIVEEDGKLHSVFIPGSSKDVENYCESDFSIVQEGYIALSFVSVNPDSGILVEGDGVSL